MNAFWSIINVVISMQILGHCTLIPVERPSALIRTVLLLEYISDAEEMFENVTNYRPHAALDSD